MKLAYWASTSLVSIMLLSSASIYIWHNATIQGFRELGFPDFFRIELAVFKILAVVVLMAPIFPIYVKEWAGAGTVLFLITAIVAHAVHKDSIFLAFFNIFFLILMATSNYTMRKMAETGG